MKKINFTSTILLLLAISCTSKKSSIVQITVDTDSMINVMQGGIGCNIHAIEDSLPIVEFSVKNGISRFSYGGSAWGANPKLDDSAGWNKLFELADWLGMDWCRVGIQFKMFEPGKNKFTFDNYDMKVLYKYLDYCQSRNIDVFLQNYWNNAAWLVPDSIRKNPVRLIRCAPTDINAFTDGLIKLLKHLVEIKKYTCIKQFAVNNEPFENWSWYIKSFSPDKFESPAPAMIMMAEKMKANKIPVMLSGPDISVYVGNKVSPKNDAFFKSLDAFDLHCYVTRYDWWPDSTITFESGGVGQIDRISSTVNFLKDWKTEARKQRNKPFFFSEMGTFMYGSDNGHYWNVSSYGALLKDVQLVMRMSQVGADGFCRWNFTDRGNIAGPWQTIDTWDTLKNCLLPASQYRPHENSFYMWGLLTRFIAKGSSVIKTTVEGGSDGKYQRIFATTYRSPKNQNYSIFITNDYDKEFETVLQTKSLKGSKLYKYEINEMVHKDNANIDLVPSEIIDLKDAADINIKLKPKCIVLFTTFNLKKTDKGIIED
jgi:hypothetical protein